MREEIRAALRRSGLTQAELCQRVGMSSRTLEKFLAGYQGMSVTLLERIASELGLAWRMVER